MTTTHRSRIGLDTAADGINPAPVHEQSRRDCGLTALIEGFFGFVWFGWGQADPPAGWRVALAVGAAVAVLVAVVGAVQAFWQPSLHRCTT